ncbi:MAG: HAMP domain-containing protein [Oscillatoriales cyanobacterium]|uniref:PP2C family protein-serine/threonine phosphatase n=1 Tax=unclassified Microcoleus TaxID=2642155 RepID=UPI001DE1F478|nr:MULTISPECIES: PP2C family protein-serine/threonine phosphatase [unclassified Microcoleus]TAE78361.1 MAG: HAMP domain-containing protein [Oscillatoriales cyanobacterium]TAF20984.1 MAG: HAMP domain-containing protein [Oscillatoriales cyanobacterium]TAF35848.1 MAG: HAMP domain-containing protein [Oscillatoriales cyanobacterium]
MNRKSLGIHLMNRLSYPQKFTSIGFLFAMPLALVMYLLISEINTRVDFAQKEIYGNEYLRPLRQLREHIPKLQQLNYQGFNPNLSNPDPRANLEAKIDANFESLANIDRQFGQILVASEKFNNIYHTWQNFKLRRHQWSLETYDVVYHKLALDINRLSAHLGDTSNLILDPDLDTYYLMDATLLKLPEMQKILSEIRLISQKSSARSDATPEERAKLITLAGKLRELNQNLAINMEVGFSNNPHGNLIPKLSQPLINFNSVVEQLTGQLDKLINPTAVVEYYAYLDGSDRVLTSSFELWDECVNELDFLLQKRIDSLVARKQLIYVFVLIFLGIVVYLFVCFYRAVMQTVLVLDEASKKMASGNIDHKIILDNQDELGQVVGAFNKIAEALVGANQEITVLNDRLKAENMRMSAELEVTRKIQQMLLPKNRELKEVIGLDIAGFMEAADEVGGDYYDVLQHEGRVKIGIGDVTGHGLESGVLMIMVQTAVRTLLAYNEPDPVKFLTAINSVIYNNMQRMKCDKNVSLALLDYHEGMLKLSGQHEEMIVVRCNGSVERFDTIDLGFPIGLDEDIADFVAQTLVQLHSGDVVVLYTDGITEAKNMNKVLYGLDRLIKVIKINWQRTATEIRHAVIDDVRSHIGKQKVFDDITLLVLKQK